MTDVTITPTTVVSSNTTTAKAYGTAGTIIAPGQSLWLDSSVTPNVLRPAIGTAQIQAQNTVGIALDGAAGSAQPIAYATAGDVTLGTANVLTPGQVYGVSAANAGGVAPIPDPAAGKFITVLGLATSPTNLRLGIIPLGATR